MADATGAPSSADRDVVMAEADPADQHRRSDHDRQPHEAGSGRDAAPALGGGLFKLCEKRKTPLVTLMQMFQGHSMLTLARLGTLA